VVRLAAHGEDLLANPKEREVLDRHGQLLQELPAGRLRGGLLEFDAATGRAIERSLDRVLHLRDQHPVVGPEEDERARPRDEGWH
jgi:hypothetical protein